MKWFTWTPAALALRRIHREVKRGADALDRIADAAEGYPRPRQSPPVVDAPVEVVRSSPGEMERAYAVEARLRRILGRDPTAEEVVADLDGEEVAVPAPTPESRGRATHREDRWP